MRFIPSFLALQSFAFSYEVWADASYALGTIGANPGFDYAFTLPVLRQSTAFVPVIRWNDGTTYYRYKLWTTGTEMVPYDLYAGETIPTAQNPVLEIWNVQGQLVLTMPSWTVEISPISTPSSLTDTSPITYTAS
jgi:hypothetical protein